MVKNGGSIPCLLGGAKFHTMQTPSLHPKPVWVRLVLLVLATQLTVLLTVAADNCNCDLSCIITSHPSIAVVGQVVEFRAVVQNFGPDAHNEYLGGTWGFVGWSGGLELVSAVVEGGSFEPYYEDPFGYPWNITGPLESGGSRTITVQVRVTAPGLLSADCAFPWYHHDSDRANDWDSFTLLSLAPVGSITGHVTEGEGGPPLFGVELRLSGPVEKSQSTDAAGKCVFADLPAGDYLVRPNANRFAFTPTERQASVTAEAPSAEVDFVATFSGSITGRVTEGEGGPPLPGVEIKLTGPVSSSVVTDAEGKYSFQDLRRGDYVVKPFSNDYVFSPTEAQPSLSEGMYTAQANFVATCRGLITGRVTEGEGGPALPGVEIKLTGPFSRSSFADNDGRYSFGDLPAGDYLLKPYTNAPGFTFDPKGWEISLSRDRLTAQADFVAKVKRANMVALEVIQVVQDWDNSVALVAHKPTLVRAHLELVPPNEESLHFAGARLHGKRVSDGQALPGSPLRAINSDGAVSVDKTTAHSRRGELEKSLNFELLPEQHPEWLQGRNDFRLEWTEGILKCSEPPSDGGAEPGSNGIVRAKFEEVPPLPVRFVLVGWDLNVTKGTNVFRMHLCGGDADAEVLRQRLLAIYPVSKVEMKLGQFQFDTKGAALDETHTDPLLEALGDQRRKVLAHTPTNQLAQEEKWIWFGVAVDSPTWGTVGMAWRDDVEQPVGVGRYAHLPSVGGGGDRFTVHAHEIGHILGEFDCASQRKFGNTVPDKNGVTYRRGACGEKASALGDDFPWFGYFPWASSAYLPTLGPMAEEPGNSTPPTKWVYGWNSYDRRIVSPEEVFELMSYCDSKAEDDWSWISKYTYENIGQSIIDRYGATGVLAGPRPLDFPPDEDPWLVVQGWVDRSAATGEITTSLETEPGREPGSPEPGDYLLEVLGVGGAVLRQVPFAPRFPQVDGDRGEPAEPTPLGHFWFSVPYSSDMKEVRVIHEAVLVCSRLLSPSPPTLQVGPLDTSGMGTDGKLRLAWEAGDPDGDDLTFAVEFSADNGIRWETVAVTGTNLTCTVYANLLPGTSQGRLRVVASDGFNRTAADVPGQLVIANHAPSVMITCPATNAVYAGEQQVVLRASAYDLEDGLLQDTNLVWRSSLDGILATGAAITFPATERSEGDHVLTVTATDSQGLTNAATVNIRVLRQPPPELAVGRENENVTLSWPAAVTNYVLECTVSLAPTAWSAVTNAPVATDEQQMVKLPVGDASGFFRLRRPWP